MNDSSRVLFPKVVYVRHHSTFHTELLSKVSTNQIQQSSRKPLVSKLEKRDGGNKDSWHRLTRLIFTVLGKKMWKWLSLDCARIRNILPYKHIEGGILKLNQIWLFWTWKEGSKFTVKTWSITWNDLRFVLAKDGYNSRFLISVPVNPILFVIVMDFLTEDVRDWLIDWLIDLMLTYYSYYHKKIR